MQPRLNIAKSACEIIREEVRRLFINKSSDGFHDIDSDFQFLNWGDKI